MDKQTYGRKTILCQAQLRTLRPLLNITHYTNFREVTFVNVHHAQISTFVIEVCLWYIGFVLVFISSLVTFNINRKYRLWYNVSVPYPKPGIAENTGNVELGAAPLVQHYSVFSARPGLGYGTLIQYL